MKINSNTLLLAGALLASSGQALALDVEMRGSAGIEGRIFFEDPAFVDQRHSSASVVFDPEFYYAVPDSSDGVTFSFFSRIDSADDERTHIDIRELNYLKVSDNWELRAGIGKVFWGVAEGQHLVDIVNQTDLVENIDGEDKLGQTMLNLTLLKYADYGIFDFFILPGFRDRTFPGREGRLRSGAIVDIDNATYEARNDEAHTDLAFRWAHSIDIFDIGVSHFWGTSRDPILTPVLIRNPVTGAPVTIPGTNTPAFERLTPHYAIINQTGLDLQASLEGWLLKLELISRSGNINIDNAQLAAGAAAPYTFDRYTAWVSGFEYTLVDFMETGIDLGLIAEWNYDDRQQRATSTFQNDMLIGTRWAFNDAESTEILAGVSQDLDYDTTALSLEASTRFGSSLKLTVEGRIFTAVDDRDLITQQLQDDSFIQTQLDYFF